ncbi:uncharacterized protein EV420DRAFT_774200 [Desarmillaria tabescens]|uniref:Uncharacterized protein n=1 Tax=Armillaria tabescens TaxID=1929756 RepID=A0AA39JXB7_ARMTA|nr:uncharacterized protein EV420DRAFT_774200 [Desarmillaria tabescens]KAK0449546.1 hypothetical protein EV420DRAFT_774200 [Desarmillaria tabescens]
MTACPANINEFLTFLPQQHKPPPNSTSSADSDSYTPLELVPPEHRFISSQLYPNLLLNLKDIIGGVVNDLGVGDVSCQSMQDALDDMAMVSFRTERQVSEYGGYVAEVVRPVVKGLAGRIISVRHQAVGILQGSQIGSFSFTIGRRDKTEDGRFHWVSLNACADMNVAHPVLLAQAEALSRPFSLDATRKQTGAKAMVVKLALQMVAANTEFGFFFGGYIAIAAQLVKSTDPSRLGLILLLSPAFRLSNEALPIPETLTPFQATIQPEPFLAILVAMLCANLVPGHEVKSPPAAFYQPLPYKEDEHDSGDNDEDRDGIPACSVQVGTNAV